MSNTLDSVSALIETVHRLRAPGGCPWDRKQTHRSLRPHLIEEAYEVLDVIDRIQSDEDVRTPEIQADFKEELGDLLMQVVLHAEMTDEKNVFNFFDVAQELNDKLIRRHPHVFGDKEVESAEAALSSWEAQKAKEKADRPEKGLLDSLPRALPSLQRTTRVLEKVTRVGFQWSDLTGPWSKVEEEVAELKVEVDQFEAKRNDPEAKKEARKKVEAELGDVLFTVCNIAYLTGVNPEDALRSTLDRFQSRFEHVERGIKGQGKRLEESSLEEMDQFWQEAKTIEKQTK